MSRRTCVPPTLMRRPFTLEEARGAGVTDEALRGKAWRRIASGLHCWAGWREDPLQLLEAWHRRLPAGTFIGVSAAWLHHLDVDPIHPIHIAAPLHSGIRSRRGLVVRHTDLARQDVTLVRSLPATTIGRTLWDLSRWLPEVESLVIFDQALSKGLGRAPGRRGALAEAAESPMETRLRWLLLKARLPRPEVQTDLHDAAGRFVARADLYYPSARLVIEYDGANHRKRLVEDDRRQNLVLSAGFRLLRFTAADLAERPDAIVALVRAHLGRR
jgi:very-short-patch-repair endonuclease